MEIDRELLIEQAKQASRQAYARFSHFSVGAAVLGNDGNVYVGCNVENSSYGLTMCAERSAVFAAVVGGATKIVAVAVFTPTERLVSPCGACRQVLYEFADDMQVFIANNTEHVQEFRLEELLPEGFRL
ncbi:cytidine deaminase [Aeoliella mucimassa]|uniref:Cytidine deaminase n=1 Tax=Aeoliella mucimassa TaxID=2527972 RepID=A0A518AL27_9BACT|nr:cytidine deaminase [Aeoliella mucimassa]QDU55430.1 Cytidine deaminase [Aeoliella mucimassa]